METAIVGKLKVYTFAAHYDAIGDAVILSDGDIDLLTHMEAYCEREQLRYKRTCGGDSITLTDISNAQKAGKICDQWGVGTGWNESGLIGKLSAYGIHTISQLADFCRSGIEKPGINVYHYEIKGMDQFSPFVEVTPLKAVPEKWTKRSFAQALLSGQLYRGEISYHYTDDYGMDSALGFGSGRALNMPEFAKDAIGDWGSSTHCVTEKDGLAQPGTAVVRYSENIGSSKKFWFDVNCDIQQGKQRSEARELARTNYNQMLLTSCIHIDPEDIDPGKIYLANILEQDQNSKIYCSKTRSIQGYHLRDLLEDDPTTFHALSMAEYEIKNEKFYSLSSLYDTLSRITASDDRVIPVGNHEYLASGKAVLEMTAEGLFLPKVEMPQENIGSDFESVRSTLLRMAAGRGRYMITGASIDYQKALNKLDKEYQRALGKDSKIRSFADILADAKLRQATQKQGNTEYNLLNDGNFGRN